MSTDLGAAKGASDCPCFVKLIWVPVVGGASVDDILEFIAKFYIDNPDGKTLFHSALEIQLPEGGECNRYIIELTESVSDKAESAKVGETVQHNIFGPFGYTIRLYRNGQEEDHERSKPRILLTNDCGIASNIVAFVKAQEIPDLDYGKKIGTRSGAADRWTSNSVVAWLLQRTGLNPGGIFPPDGGIAPGWDAGSSYAWDHFPF